MDDKIKCPEICLIAPTEHLAERAKVLIARKKLDISVDIGALEGAVEIAKALMAQGAWLFISRQGTKKVLEHQLGATVVDISLVASDYIPAVEQIRELKGKVAFFSAEEISDELRTICYLQGIDAKYYHFEDDLSCRRCVDAAVRDGAVLGVGGVVSEKYSKAAGMSYYLVQSSDRSIEQALETASQMYQLRRESERERERLEIQLERYKNILNYTHDAIIAINEKGRIEVTNRIAKQMLGAEKEPFEGQVIEKVLPNTHMNAVLRTGIIETDQLMKVNGTMVSTNRVPIIVNDRIRGVVATFRDIKVLQSEEQQIRIKLHEKGLTAKYHFTDVIGTSEVLCSTKALAADFADSQFTVMLYGETGSGKELFAQSIHNASSRKKGPFVAINCTAFSKTLLESELFGYVEGSFTGAKKGGKAGLFELAHGGTIFLDEIGELPMEFQAQFLRVIQEKEIRRVGGDFMIPVDIRIVGATNRDLMKLVEAGEFRRDLYYRLNVLNLTIPPLCRRGNDYLLIADAIYQKTVPGYQEHERESFLAIMESYRGYPWPGNVRELNNVVDRICLLQKRGMTQERIITALQTMFIADNGVFISGQALAAPECPEKEACNETPLSLEEAEYRRIRAVLERNEGNITRTALELKVSRSTLYRKLKQDNVSI